METIQYKNNNYKDIENMIGQESVRYEKDNDDEHVKVYHPVIAIRTVFNWERLFPGYWIIKDNKRIVVCSQQRYNMLRI